MLQLTRVLRAHRHGDSNADDDDDGDGDEPTPVMSPPSTVAPGAAVPAALELVLGYEDRRRSRLRVAVSDGREGALLLARGTVLREGDRVVSRDGAVIVTIRAADENLSVARTPDPHLLARAAYHLGNRHVPLQVRPGSLAYQHDHVLDGLVRELGLTVRCEAAPFEPEAGGYRHHGTETSRHSHEHEHEHEREHAQAPPHGQGHGSDHPHGHEHGHERGHRHSGHRP